MFLHYYPQDQHHQQHEEQNLQARLENSHGILMKEDKISDVLDDNAVIFITAHNTTSSSGE